MTVDNTNHENDAELEEQAKHWAGLLDSHAQRLSMRTLKKLEDSRIQAVNVHQKHRGGNLNADGTLSHWAAWLSHYRTVFAGLVLLAIIISFLVLQNMNSHETSDAFLLAADLPPEAFVDRGFEPSLNKHVSI